jgi:hypothetical protein
MLKDLVKLANRLDSKGLKKEADYLDAIIKVASVEDNLELLDDALSTLNALRMEMDPDFGPQEMPDEERVRLFEEEEDAKSLMEEGRLRRDLGF